MARIERESKFNSYKIIVETREEHLFLKGLLNASGSVEKNNCNDYSNKLNTLFFDLVDDAEHD